MEDFFNYRRRKSSIVNIGNTPLGGDNPIRIQSMANVSTMDTDAAVCQAIRMIEAGAEYVRFTAQGEREARNLGVIRKQLSEAGYTTPLVADIHFNPRAADAAAEEVEKVRINPGNYVDKVKTFDLQEYTDEEYAAELQKIRDRFIPFLNICKAHGTAIRIGVNHGSLSDHLAASAATMLPEEVRPAFAVLIYPVITAEPGKCHKGSFDNLLGTDRTAGDEAQWSLQNRVTASTPPTLLLLADDDRTVPPVNSTLFYEALKRNGVKGCSLRIYPSGGHGGGFNPDRIYRTAWRADVLDWLGTLPNSASH